MRLLLLASLVLTGCIAPREAPDTRPLTFGIQLEDDRDGRPVAEPMTLTVHELDAEELGLESRELHEDFGIFTLHPDIEVDGGGGVEYCLQGPIVIEDDASGEVVVRIDTGTCLVEADYVVVKRSTADS